MKKLILFIAVIFIASLSTEAQKNYVLETLSTLTLNGEANDTTEAYKILYEGDWSYQFKSAVSGEGDSAGAVIKIYVSNPLSGDVWTELTSERDTITEARKEELVEGTDFQNSRIRAILTGTSTDTCTVIPYLVIKKFDSE